MIEFGPPIEVDGVRPEWLRDDDHVDARWDEGGWYSDVGGRGVSAFCVCAWGTVTHIRLPADHPHYTKDTSHD